MSKTLPARIMISKPGLDGHDRGAVLIVQALRDAGFDVIYTGLRRTPRQIAVAAAQEDVDVLGASCMSGAHIVLLSAVVKELDALHWRPTLLLAGGIIPPRDVENIETMGYSTVFGPGTSLKSIAEAIAGLVPARTTRSATSAPTWVQMATQLTTLELETTRWVEKQPQSGKIVVVAGQGGSGKSTLIGSLIKVAQQDGLKLAVLANDPANPISQGSILADRLRMPMDFDADRVLIRSLPVHGTGEIVASSCGQIATTLAVDYDLVIVETIGVGQNQPVAFSWPHITVSVVAPGSGDHWQLRKNALLETCHTLVIHKCDLPEAQRHMLEVQQVLHDVRGDKLPALFKTSLDDGASAQALLDHLINA